MIIKTNTMKNKDHKKLAMDLGHVAIDLELNFVLELITSSVMHKADMRSRSVNYMPGLQVSGPWSISSVVSVAEQLRDRGFRVDVLSLRGFDDRDNSSITINWN